MVVTSTGANKDARVVLQPTDGSGNSHTIQSTTTGELELSNAAGVAGVQLSIGEDGTIAMGKGGRECVQKAVTCDSGSACCGNGAIAYGACVCSPHFFGADCSMTVECDHSGKVSLSGGDVSLEAANAGTVTLKSAEYVRVEPTTAASSGVLKVGHSATASSGPRQFSMEVGTGGDFELQDTRGNSQLSVGATGDIALGGGSMKTGDVVVSVSEGKSITLQGGPAVRVEPSGANMAGTLELAHSGGGKYTMQTSTAGEFGINDNDGKWQMLVNAAGGIGLGAGGCGASSASAVFASAGE